MVMRCLADFIGEQRFLILYWGYMQVGYSVGVRGVDMLVGDMVVDITNMHFEFGGTCYWGTLWGGGV